MDNIQKIVLIVHTLIALLIIALVLLQRGKGADAGAAFGAGASGTVFGARGSSSFFSRATALLATAFFVSSLSLAYLSSQATSGPESLLDDAPAVEQTVDDASSCRQWAKRRWMMLRRLQMQLTRRTADVDEAPAED